MRIARRKNRHRLDGLLGCLLGCLLAAAMGCSGTRTTVRLEEDPRVQAIAARSPAPLDYKVAILPLLRFDHETLNSTRSQQVEKYSLGLDREDYSREQFRDEVVALLGERGVFARVRKLGDPGDPKFEKAEFDERDIGEMLDPAWEAREDIVIALKVTRWDCVFLEHQYQVANYFLWFMLWVPHFFVPDEVFGADLEVQAQVWSVHSRQMLGTVTWHGSSHYALTDNERGWLYMGLVPGWASMNPKNWRRVHDRVMPLALDDLKANVLAWAQLSAEELAAARGARVFQDLRSAPAPQETGEQGFRALETTPAFHEKMSKRLALVVGVSEHADTQIPALQFAARDAELMKEFFEDPARGHARDHGVWVRQNANATKANILADLDEIAERALPDDEVFIYFAGYAATLPPSEELLMQGITERSLLVTHDTTLEALEATGIADAELAMRLAAIRAERLVLVLDAAFDGAPARRSLTDRLSADVSYAQELFERNLYEKFSKPTMIQIVSNVVGQGAYEHEDLRDGLFTYYFLEGASPIEGHAPADRDADGRVTLREAFEYAQQWVEEQSMTQGFIQRPYAVGPPLERVNFMAPVAQ